MFLPPTPIEVEVFDTACIVAATGVPPPAVKANRMMTRAVTYLEATVNFEMNAAELFASLAPALVDAGANANVGLVAGVAGTFATASGVASGSTGTLLR